MFLKYLWVYNHVALTWLDSLVQEAMLWFKRKCRMNQKQVMACNSLFLFIVKIRFPRRAQTTWSSTRQPPIQTATVLLSSTSSPFMSAAWRQLKGWGPYLHARFEHAGHLPHCSCRIVGLTTIKIFQWSKVTNVRFHFFKY